MGEVLYRWLSVKRQEKVPGAFLFLNRYRTGSKTGGQLPGLVFPDDVRNPVSESGKIVPVIRQKTNTITFEYQEKEKRWQGFSVSGGSVKQRCGKIGTLSVQKSMIYYFLC
jgi:hypothetical protein